MSDEGKKLTVISKVVTERELLTRILKQYKNSPCLWDSTNKFYFNKQVKEDCYEEMLDLWQQLDPGGTVQTLKKKIEHFRAAYRREWKKVENSIVCGENPDTVHKPTLWYYKHLLFLNEKPDVAKDSSDEEVEKDFVHLPPKKKRKTSQRKYPLSTGKGQTSEDMEEHVEKRNSREYVTTYGQSIARQLGELDDQVRYEAERIISDVIYRARTGTLPKYSPQVVDSFGIPQSGPSWYDAPVDQETQPHTECVVVKVEDPSDPTIKTELEESEIISSDE